MDTARVQQVLAKMGLPPTRQGVARFQVAVKLPPTGVVDDRTAWALTQARVAPDNVRLAGFNSFGIIAPPTGTAAAPVVRAPPTQAQTYTGATGQQLPAQGGPGSAPPVVQENGVASQGGGFGLVAKVLVFAAVAGGSYYFYRRSQKKLVVGGYDDAGPVLSLWREGSGRKKKRSRARGMGADDSRPRGRGVEAGEGAPEADVQKGYNPRARRFLRKQRVLYPVMAPDVVGEEMRKRDEDRDAPARQRWLRGGKKRGPVGPGRGVIESREGEGTRAGPTRGGHGRTVEITDQVVNEKNVERFLTLPNMTTAQRARLTKDDRRAIEAEDKAHRKLLIKAGTVEAGDEENPEMVPIVEEIAHPAGAGPKAVRLDVDEKQWKQQAQYRNDMKRIAHERAHVGHDVHVVVRGTRRVLYTVKAK